MLIITMGHNSINIARGVEVPVLSTSSEHDLHEYQVSRKYLNGLRIMERTQFLYLLLQRGVIS